MTKIKLLSKGEKFLYLTFILLNLISLIVLLVLVGSKTIKWNWVTGYLLSFVFSLFSFWLIYVSANLLVKTENHFLYIFMYLLRLGLYFIPLLFAFLIPGTPFYFVGVLIGFIPSLVLPKLNAVIMNNKVKKKPSENQIDLDDKIATS